MDKIVDVIIPVYGDYEKTKACIESVIAAKDNNVRVIIINDKSPVEEINNYLQKISGKNSSIKVINHDINLGFVKTVNEGMSLSLDNDVVLLNSDTVVSKGWLRKMINVAYSDPFIATVTPFSNAATIFSYPNFFQDNEILEGTTVEQMNKYFEKASFKDIVSVPSGVGFAMFIRRDAINQIGLFDEEAFGRGYGEENDFCFKVNRLGLKNVGCPDTFIYHNHGASFGEEKYALMANADKVLEERYPRYRDSIQKFANHDPFLGLRAQVDYLRLVDSGKLGILYVSHDRGGGVAKHVLDISSVIAEKYNVFILEPTENGVILKSFNYENLKMAFTGDDWYNSFISALKCLGVSYVHYHSWIGYDQDVYKIPESLEVKYSVTLHDYHAICPSIHLANKRGEYCFSKQSCEKCFGLKNLSGYWKRSMDFLEKSESVYVPSSDMKKRIGCVLSGLKLVVWPHYEPQNEAEQIKPILGKQLRILVFGNITELKGLSLLERVIKKSKKYRNIKWFVAGNIDRRYISLSNCKFLGDYQNLEQLTSLARKSDINIAFFPMNLPETYSYTLSEAWKMGIPALTFNIGAQGERVRSTGAGWTSEEFNAEAVLRKLKSILDDFEGYQKVIGNMPATIEEIGRHKVYPYKFNVKKKDFYKQDFQRVICASTSFCRELNLANTFAPSPYMPLSTTGKIAKFITLIKSGDYQQAIIKTTREIKSNFKKRV